VRIGSAITNPWLAPCIQNVVFGIALAPADCTLQVTAAVNEVFWNPAAAWNCAPPFVSLSTYMGAVADPQVSL
jgi:hypothetical protein